jgi:hypothetical protein
VCTLIMPALSVGGTVAPVSSVRYVRLCPWPAPFTAGRRGSTAVPLDPAAILQQRDEEDRAAMMEMHRRMSAGRRRLSFVPAVCVCVCVCVCPRCVCVPAVCVCVPAVGGKRGSDT